MLTPGVSSISGKASYLTRQTVQLYLTCNVTPSLGNEPVTYIVQYATNTKWNRLDTSPEWKIIDGLLEGQSGRYRMSDQLEDQNVAGEMTLWGNNERYGRG